MELLIESTDHVTTIDGVECRVWEGVTAGGLACYVFVRLVAVVFPRDQAALEAELRVTLQPATLQPLRDVLRGAG
jgi:hypothetical protein